MLSNYRGTAGVNEADKRLSSMRAEEREKKRLAEELNRSYRRSQNNAVDEVDSKLKDLKEQDRQNKKLTEEWNHSYRMQENMIAGTSSPSKTSNHHNHDNAIVPDVVAPSQQKKDPWDSIARGSVSEKAANFNSVLPMTNSQDSSDEKKTEAPKTEAFVQPTVDLNGLNDNNNNDNETNNLFLQQPIREDETPAVEVEKELPIESPVAVQAAEPVETHDYSAPLPPLEMTTEAKQEQHVESSSAVPMEEAQTHDPLPPVEMTTAAFMTPAPEQQQQQDMTPDEEVQPQEQQHENQYAAPTAAEPAPAATIAPVRMDISVSFGLITMNSQPSFAGYIYAVEEIVKHTLSQNVQWNAEVSLNSDHCPPLVVSANKDDTFVDVAGRSNIQRVLVQILLPLFFSNGGQQQMVVRNDIIRALTASVQTGNFLNLALSQTHNNNNFF